MSDTLQQQIEKIQASQRKLKIIIGVIIGIILLIYFFTFSMLIDSAPRFFINFQIISSIVMVAMLFFLNPISFFLVVIRYRLNESLFHVVAKMKPSDISRPAQELAEELSRQE